MPKEKRVNDAVFKYIDKFTSEIVAESGNPADKFHLGKMVLKGLRDNAHGINQIDGGTGESETNGSVLLRSTRLASCMRKFGLQRGDVIALLAPNHIHLCVPYYAALYLGVIVMAADRTLALKELVAMFEIGKPKIVFCQSEKASDIQLALNQLDMDSQIVTFDSGDYLTNITDFVETYDDEDYNVDTFKASEFDGADTIAFIISTSGTTGLPKAAAATHKNFAITGRYVWCRHTHFPSPTKLAMICSPLQWLTALINFLMGAIYSYTRLQSSSNMDQQHCYELINKYRPTWTISSPTMMTTLLKMPDRLQCDFTCFEDILLGGSAVSVELIETLKMVSGANVSNAYGMSELTGLGFMCDDTSPPSSCGKPIGCLQYRLINLDTGEDILEPLIPGELWLRGPGVFKEYYNNTEATAETFSEGRWFRTGDMLYRDAMDNYYYVDRIKLMLKYKSYQISPVELENLIRTHPDVVDAVVTGVPDAECGDLVVACVVRRSGSQLAAQHVKDLVKDNLSESKHLHGGVIFLEEIPVTSTTKVHRRKIKELAATMPREFFSWYFIGLFRRFEQGVYRAIIT